MVADVVDDLHREYGFWQVARALVVSALVARRNANGVQHFSDHMLRDIGIEPNTLVRNERLNIDPLTATWRRSRR
jgi:uncharacterized protein YjiS (DUF1127 family)